MTNQPNLLLITTDQLRRDSLGCYGGTVIDTPNLDRLAGTSTIYDNAWTASPWCLPSRSSIMTGCYPHTHRAYSNFRDCRLSQDRPNLYNTLGGLGYQVNHVGKCHYAPVPYGETKPDRTLPYTEFRDYYLSLGIDQLDLQDDKQVSVWFRDDYAEELDQAGHLEAYRAKVWDKDAAKVFTFPAPAEWHPDAWVGRKAVERINRADQAQPQFTWVSISGPHFPFDPPAEYQDRVDPNRIADPVITGDLDDPARMHYWSRHGAPGQWIESGRNDRYDDDYWRQLRTNYYANVALIDDVIGDVIGAAEERFGDDLVVIFTPDHGEMLGNHGIWGKGHCFYNDVLNVPFLVRRPGVTPGRSNDLVSLIDIFPTLVGLAGGDSAPSAGSGRVDGLSLAGDERHQILLSEGEGFVTATDGRHKLARAEAHGRRFAELFDLAEDPGELINRSGDPDHAAAERDLSAAINAALLSAALP